MTLQRQIENARAYCNAIGKDPEEKVRGYVGKDLLIRPLYQWMLGADPSVAEGATELSPKQNALLQCRRTAR